MWVQVALWLVSMAITYALTPKPKDAKPAALSDFDVPTASADRSIPIVFGRAYLRDPNVVWYGNLIIDEIKSKGK